MRGSLHINAKATVRKRGGRTKIDATIDAPQFDFDDLADDAGLAAARAKEARIGKRVTLVGQPDMIGGAVQGLVRITGHGTTIREAFSNGTGKIAFTASRGSMNRAAAFVLGQDLGGAIGQKLGNDDAMTPLTCAILAFDAKNGVLRPAPFLIVTAVSRGSGRGQINLDGETVALTIIGASSDKPALKLVDPLQIGSTFSNPSITIADKPATGKGSGKGIIGSIGRSIGSALGLRKDDGPKIRARPYRPSTARN